MAGQALSIFAVCLFRYAVEVKNCSWLGAAFVACLAFDWSTMELCGQSVAVSFNRDVRPILSDKCFACHGPDEAAREGDLRLDVRAGALEAEAFVPGDVAGSELVRRITAIDEDDLMPPPDFGHSLGEAEIEMLVRWIAEGAEYEQHWAFLAPRRADIGAGKIGIDELVKRRLQRDGLGFSPEADKAVLIRRLSLDLTGLPPGPEEVKHFINDGKPGAYLRVVNRLLSSPRYGEHMALYWLDAARYADTHGYFADKERTMWPWRDWVIEAYNRNLPFDQFTIEQLAGDLLPEATEAQRIATGFNRNHMINNESGIIGEEFRVEYVADRVKTTSTLWLGLTMECARCHDHKFDPLSQREYYEMFAYFNQVPEKGLDGSSSGGGAVPFLKVPTPQQRTELKKRKQELAVAEKEFLPFATAIDAAQAKWEVTALSEATKVPGESGRLVWLDFEDDDKAVPGRPVGAVKRGIGMPGRSISLADSAHWMLRLDEEQDAALEGDRAFSFGAWAYPTSGAQASVVSKIDDSDSLRGFDLQLRKGKAVVQLAHRWNTDAIQVATTTGVKTGQWQHFAVTYDGSGSAHGVTIYIDGVRQPTVVKVDSLKGSIATREPLRIGRRQASASFSGRIDGVFVYRRELAAEEVFRTAGDQLIRGVAAVEQENRETKAAAELREHFVAHHAAEDVRRADVEIRQVRDRVSDLEKSFPEVMVMQDMAASKMRATQLLERGEYNKPGAVLSASVPAVLLAAEQSHPARGDRLGLARWLVSGENPLTARVTVNRLWQQVFGRGLVATLEDFGLQGEWPTHPALLDWLALELVESGWDVQHVLRLILTSATYRQSSDASPDLVARDPENRLLARGPRFRLLAEQIRDQALLVSGLLRERIGGPSVMPYQPPGLWTAVTYDGELAYLADEGEGRYRRSLYSYWKRQLPPPAMTAFDAPTRETCVVERSRTNTPLQALVLMNDPNFIEAARHLAELDASENASQGVATMFQRVLARKPRKEEVAELLGLLAEQSVYFSEHREEATALVGGEEAANVVNLAAWTTVANVVLSLDETLTKR